MSKAIHTMPVSEEYDVVLARQRTRRIAGLLGLSLHDQTRISTAVSEIVRNALKYAGAGRVEFLLDIEAQPQVFLVRVSDRGPGVPPAERPDGTGMLAAKRLVDQFHVDTTPGRGTTVLLGKLLPLDAPPVSAGDIHDIAARVEQRGERSPFEEIQRQNHELLMTMSDLNQRQEELARVNRELEDTNRGVIALYAELEEKADYLRRADEQKTSFLSSVSHELRTPINSILAISRILLDEEPEGANPERRKQVRLVHDSAVTLSELVNDLLDLAKIQSGRVDVSPGRFTVSNLFSALRGMMRPLQVNPAVALVFEEAPGLPELETDESKASQVMRNLISNGLKFTEKGEVRVSARLDDRSGAILFTVADTGIGIAREDQERIFGEFVQLRSPLAGRSKGTGLGLSISRKLAALLGGRLSVESERGRGSIFTFSLPPVYRHAAPVPAEPAKWEPPPAPVPETVAEAAVEAGPPLLVVEHDDAEFIRSRDRLQEVGFRPLRARTAGEARDALRSVRPEAVVIDLAAHEDEGLALLSELKAGEETRDIPAVVLFDGREAAEQAAALGADGRIAKPADPRQLVRTLNELTIASVLKTVLIIDDDESSRYLLKQMLEDMGLEVLDAADGPSGLELARTRQPQMIFLDLLMPVMSGFDVLDLLRKSTLTRDIAVVIKSAKILDEAEHRRLVAGTAAIILKRDRPRSAIAAELRETFARLRAETRRRRPPKEAAHAQA